jgi:hypothetical protein
MSQDATLADDEVEQAERVEQVIAESGRPIDATAEDPVEPDIPPDRARGFTHTGFSRMRITWLDDDQERLAIVRATANDIIQAEFRVAFAVLDMLHRQVRRPLADSDGVVQTYDDGSPKWELDEYGVPTENWGRLDPRTRENAMHVIAVFLVEMELKAVDLWAEAMFAKVIWEEKFAKNFTALPKDQLSGKPTIQDRTQWGHRNSTEERYFAVFCAVLSKKADALVRSMNRLYKLLENTATT